MVGLHLKSLVELASTGEIDMKVGSQSYRQHGAIFRAGAGSPPHTVDLPGFSLSLIVYCEKYPNCRIAGASTGHPVNKRFQVIIYNASGHFNLRHALLDKRLVSRARS